MLARKRPEPGVDPNAPREISVAELLSTSGTGSMTEGTRGVIAARAMEADREAERVIAQRAAERRAAERAAAEQAERDARQADAHAPSPEDGDA